MYIATKQERKIKRSTRFSTKAKAKKGGKK